MARIQKKNGEWLHFGCSNGWTGLALLATGDKKYLPNIRKTAHTLAKKYEIKDHKKLTKDDLIKQVGALDNWPNTVAGIFLAEYYLATGDKKVLTVMTLYGASVTVNVIG